MNLLAIIGLVVFAVVVTLITMWLIGLREAADPEHSHPDDLSDLEWKMVGDEREQRSADNV